MLLPLYSLIFGKGDYKMQFLSSKRFNAYADFRRNDIDFRAVNSVPFAVSIYGDSGTKLYQTEDIQTTITDISKGILVGSLKPNMHLTESILAPQMIDYGKNGSYMEQESNIESDVEFNACDISIISVLNTTNTDISLKFPKMIAFNVKDAPCTYSTEDKSLQYYVTGEYNNILGEYWYEYEKPVGDLQNLPFLYIMCFPKSITINMKKLNTAPKSIAQYSTTKQYYVGDLCYHSFRIYSCIEDTIGAFADAKWHLVA